MNSLLEIEKELDRERNARISLEKELELYTRQLFENFNYNKKIFDSLGIGVIVTKEDGTFALTNTSANKMLGIEKVSIKYNVLEFLKINPKKVKDIFKNSIVNHHYEFECQLSSVSGDRIPVNVDIVKVMRGAENEEFIFSIKDLTENKKREAKIKEMKDQLIENAYKEGIAENAVSVLHNIGNVLTTILGHISNRKFKEKVESTNQIMSKINETIKSEDLGSWNEQRKDSFVSILGEVASTFKQFEQQCDTENDFVKERCLHIGKIISTQQKYANYKDKTKVDLNLLEAVNSCMVMHEDRMGQKSIDINIDVSPTTHIIIEKIGLSQTLSNAIINAVDAIEMRKESEPKFSKGLIEIWSEEKGSDVKLFVRDNGCGISEEVKNKLFNFGYSTKSRGSGFGLHSCANFMSNNDGKIELESPGVNQGCTTKLTFRVTP